MHPPGERIRRVPLKKILDNITTMSKNIFIGSVAINVDGDASAADPIDPNQLADVEYVVSTNFMKNRLRDLLTGVAMKVNLTAAEGADADDFASYIDSADALRQRVDVVKSTQLVAGKFDLNRLEADTDGDVGKISATLSSLFGTAQGADPVELLDGSGITTHSIALDRVNDDSDITVASGLPKAIGRQVDLADNDERIFRLMVEPSTMRNLAAFGIRAYGGRDRSFQDGDETKSLSKLIESKSVAALEDRSFDQLNDVNSSAAPGTRELAHELLHLLFRDDPPTDANTTLKKNGEPADLKKKWVYDAAAGTLALNYVEHNFRLQFLVVSELDIVKEGEANPLSCTKASPPARVVAVDGADAPENPINPKRVLIRYDFNFDGANEILGCMDTRARNFFAYANIDDGSCEIEGCTDTTADNFDASDDANVDDGSCLYDGCTVDRATNYDPNANRDDGSCLINGCMDSRSNNYDSEATVNTGCVFSSTPDLLYTTVSTETLLRAPATVPGQFESDLTDTNVLLYVGDMYGDTVSANVNVFHYKGARKLTVIDDMFDMREQPFEISGYQATEGSKSERGVWLKLADVLAGDQIHFDVKLNSIYSIDQLRLALYQKNSAGEFVNVWNRGTGEALDARHIITFDANRDGSHEEKIEVNGQIVDVVAGCMESDADNYNATANRIATCTWENSAPKTIVWGAYTHNMQYSTGALKEVPDGMSVKEVLTERLLTEGHANAFVSSSLGSGVPMWQARAHGYSLTLVPTAEMTITSMTVMDGTRLNNIEAAFAAGVLTHNKANFIPIEVTYKGPSYEKLIVRLGSLYITNGIWIKGNHSQEPLCGIAGKPFADPGHIILDNSLCLADGLIPVMNRADNGYEALEGDVLLGLKLKDSFGDGWQAATITLFSHPGGIEQVKAGETFTVGAEADRMFAIENDTLYKLVADGGSFPAESSVDVYNVVDGAFGAAAVDTLDPEDAASTKQLYFKMVNGVYTPMHIEVAVDGTETLKEGESPVDNGDGKYYLIEGCTDSAAFNYNADANVDDGSCVTETKTVAMIVEEQFSSSQWIHYQSDTAAVVAMADLINIPGVTANEITLSYPKDTSKGAAFYAALPNWQYSTDLYFAQRITFQAPANFDVAALGTRLGNEISFSSSGTWIMRAVTDIVDVVDTGCTDLGATNFNLAAQADDGTCA